MLGSLTKPKSQQTLSDMQGQYVEPTKVVTFPTRIPTTDPSLSATLAPTKTIAIFDFAYPLKYENLIVDYLPSRNQIIIYYPNSKENSEATFKKFLEQYKTGEAELSGIKIDYIGLTRDPNEATSGSLLR